MEAIKKEEQKKDRCVKWNTISKMIVKSSGINNYIKCKWSKYYNQKIEIVKLD